MSNTPPKLPVTLQRLGFVSRVLKGVGVIVPPTCEIPAGPFTMGGFDVVDSTIAIPVHVVQLARFWLGKYPVTVAEYQCAVAAGAVPDPQQSVLMSNFHPWPQQLTQPDHPVIGLQWSEALAYTRWRASVSGTAWRLPTEAEWEKAARGTDQRRFPWGNDEEAWQAAREARGTAAFQAHLYKANVRGSGPGTTTSIGAFPTDLSPYGVQGMAGNVQEWCSSLLSPYPYRADDGREEPSAAGRRVVRGGSFDTIDLAATTTQRKFGDPIDCGLRLAHS